MNYYKKYSNFIQARLASFSLATTYTQSIKNVLTRFLYKVYANVLRWPFLLY